MAEPTTGALVVFALILIALILFVAEPVPNDTTAIGVLVALVVLEPYTRVPARDAISGFASPAVVTIIAMYILSAGVERTGAVDRLGYHVERFTRGDETRLNAATVGTAGLSAGVINNTPVVAVFIPMIKRLAEDSGISPSRLLLPLSYAAMLGGTLTLIGTSTNLLASDLSARLLDHPISMFEFTPLGLLALGAGALYLLVLAPRLVPERIRPRASLLRSYEMESHLDRYAVTSRSPLVDRPVRDLADLEDVELLKVKRDGETFRPSSDQTLRAEDLLTLKGRDAALRRFARANRLERRKGKGPTASDLAEPEHLHLVEAIVTPDSPLDGNRLADTALPKLLDVALLAIRRGDETLREDLGAVRIRAGDTLLLQTKPGAAAFLTREEYLVVTHAVTDGKPGKPPLSPSAPAALGVLAAVVLTAALGLLSIPIAALGGVVALVATRCIDPVEAYDAVSWNVIFLLAGVIPLGIAMQRTGGADLLAQLLVAAAGILPPLALLVLVYLLTGLLANLITPVATVVLMIPIAVDAAAIGATQFSFLLAVTFAASSAFMTPIGYQTNLMVYGPGGYRFTDYLRVGAPLQLLLAAVVPLGIALLWGL